MAANKLRKDEVQYELRIRNLPTLGDANELRKRLNQALASNTPVDDSVISELDVDKEIESCEEKFSDLSSLVESYEGNYADNEYMRLSARLSHLYNRLERLENSADMDAETETRLGNLMSTTKSLIDSFVPSKQPSPIETKDKDSTAKEGTVAAQSEEELVPAPANVNVVVSQNMPSHVGVPSSSQVQVGSLSVNPQPVVATIKDIEHTAPRKVPVFKWGLSFSNDQGLSIGAFLERAEELRRARGLTHEQLFQSAVDLFSGSALVWYRSTVGRIHTWGELCKEMKLVFQSPDYDDMLDQEIMSRTQGEQEPIDIYLAAMEGLYKRLANPVPESQRLRRILKNLNPYLQDKLCLVKISTLEELRELGRKAELGRLRSNCQKPPPKPNMVLEPDLAYTFIKRKGVPTNHVSSLRAMPPRNSQTATCWNCSKTGHCFRDCKENRAVFCYGCGNKGVKKPACDKCRPKNA
jgi:hypothetical protein